MEATAAVFYCVIGFFIYKILDRLLRLPKIGKYSERYILVTGCDTGFGHEICKRLDKMGCHVFAGCLTEKGETELKKCCSDRLKTLPMNVADSSSVAKAYAVIENALPQGKGLWGILNNAGILGNIGPVEWLTLKDYQQVLDVNLLGLVDVTMTFLPLVKRTRGRIVNTASVFGRCSLTGSTPYCISKYGVESFSDCLRRQLQWFGVRVHLIEPGFHKTNMAEGLEMAVRKSWSKASTEAKEEYGEEFLEKIVASVLKTFVSGIISERISDVLDAYEHALLGMFPRARYVVGNDARFVWIPLNLWIPEWLGDWLLDLVNGKPIPRAMKVGKYQNH